MMVNDLVWVSPEPWWYLLTNGTNNIKYPIIAFVNEEANRLEGYTILGQTQMIWLNDG